MRFRDLVFLTLLLPVAVPVTAGTAPDPANSSIPNFIDVVGSAKGVIDPRGKFTIVIRNFEGNPLSGVTVTLDFTNCSDLRLSLLQQPGVSLSCDPPTISSQTDAAGQVSFTIVGAGNVPGCLDPTGTGPATPCIRVCADGVFMGVVSAAIYDLDGALSGDGVSASDWAQVNRAFLGASYRSRYDYNHDGSINNADLATYADIFPFGGGSRDGSGGAGYCPSPVLTFACP